MCTRTVHGVQRSQWPCKATARAVHRQLEGRALASPRARYSWSPTELWLSFHTASGRALEFIALSVTT